MFEVGDVVDRNLYPAYNDDSSGWSPGWVVVESPENPLGDCIYIEKDGHIVGSPPLHLRHSIANNPEAD